MENLAARFQRDAMPLLPELFQRALRLTRNHHDAEDLLQETLANAYRGYRMFQRGSNFRAWLYRIEVNAYINGYRKNQRQPVQYPTADMTDLPPTAMDRIGSPWLRSAEDQVLEKLPDGDIKSAMQSLPEQFRMTIYYADVEGFRYQDIAALTNAPIGTVMSRLHRGRRQLRGLLAAARESRYALATAS